MNKTFISITDVIVIFRFKPSSLLQLQMARRHQEMVTKCLQDGHDTPQNDGRQCKATYFALVNMY